MKSNPVPALVAAMLLLSGCASMKVSCESDPSYAFDRIQTYQWSDASKAVLERNDTYLDEALQNALNNELAMHGWKQVPDAARSSVQVTYYVQINEHKEYVDSSRSDSEFAGGLVYKTGQWNYEERGPDQNVYTVEAGIIHVQLLDTASGKRIWSGTLQTKLDRSASTEKQHELYSRAAHKLLERLPAGSSK